jgi:hypothetical protein
MNIKTKNRLEVSAIRILMKKENTTAMDIILKYGQDMATILDNATEEEIEITPEQIVNLVKDKK